MQLIKKKYGVIKREANQGPGGKGEVGDRGAMGKTNALKLSMIQEEARNSTVRDEGSPRRAGMVKFESENLRMKEN